MGCARGDPSAMVARALRALEAAPADLSVTEQRRLADQAVLAFPVVPTAGGGEPGPAGELRAVIEGLKAVCARNPGAALECVRPISHHSAFSHWKLFVKGLAAFYQGDRAKAARCWAELPATR
jgi:hypothetical protein